MDYAIVAGTERSPMGFFRSLYEPGAKHPWNAPKEEDIKCLRGNCYFKISDSVKPTDLRGSQAVNGKRKVGCKNFYRKVNFLQLKSLLFCFSMIK